MGDSGFTIGNPTPLRVNERPRFLWINAEGEWLLDIVPSTQSQTQLEISPSLKNGTWSPVHEPIPGIEFEYPINRTLQPKAFYRLREID